MPTLLTVGVHADIPFKCEAWSGPKMDRFVPSVSAYVFVLNMFMCACRRCKCLVVQFLPTCIVLSPRSGLPACMHLHHLASADSMFKGCVLEISIPKDYKFGKWNPFPCTQSFGSTGWPSAQEMERSLIFKMLPAWALWPYYFFFWFCSRSEPWWSDDECFHVAKTFIVIEVKFIIHKLNVGSHLLLSRMCVQVQNAMSPANRKQPFSISS